MKGMYHVSFLNRRWDAENIVQVSEVAHRDDYIWGASSGSVRQRTVNVLRLGFCSSLDLRSCLNSTTWLALGFLTESQVMLVSHDRSSLHAEGHVSSLTMSN